MLSITCLQGALVLSFSTGLPAQPSTLAARWPTSIGVELTPALGMRPTVSLGLRPAVPLAWDGKRVRAEFDKALEKHTKAIEKTDSHKARAKLEAKHPARKFWRKFASEARKGDGPSVAWMLEFVKLAGFDEKKTNAEMAKVLELLTSKFSGAPWIGDSLELVHLDREALGAATLRPLYEAVAAGNENRSNQAMALYRLAWMEKRAGKKDEAERIFEDLAKNFRNTKFGTTAASTRTSKEASDAGGSAPDFYAETLEGHAVSLSDYRGKVVLLDFYGFW